MCLWSARLAVSSCDYGLVRCSIEFAMRLGMMKCEENFIKGMVLAFIQVPTGVKSAEGALVAASWVCFS